MEGRDWAIRKDTFWTDFCCGMVFLSKFPGLQGSLVTEPSFAVSELLKSFLYY